MTADPETELQRPADRGVARRQAFLNAARQVFLENGYEAASVNDVVRLAGGSLATLYAQFGNKEGLFLAVSQDQHDRFIRAMTPASVGHLPLEAALQQIGEHFLRALLARDNIAFFRLVIGEGRKFPQLLQRYLSSGGADRVRAELAGHLRGAGISDAETCASYFIELLRSRHHYRALADDSYSLPEKQLSEHVAGAVRFLLRGMNLG
ncbi:MAG: TetR/AcrR family transcriptional regulator [Hyphomonadaceae bacterium]